MCGLSKKHIQSLHCLHPNSAICSHMSHWNIQGPTCAPKSLRAICPSGSSVVLCWKMNSAQNFYSSWRLYLKRFSTVLGVVSHFGCVTKQILCAGEYKFWLHKTTLKLELRGWIRTELDPLNQIAQIFSAAKIKADFCPESFLSLLSLQESLTRDLSSFYSTTQTALSSHTISKQQPRQGFIVRECKQITGSAVHLSQVSAHNFN